ncbi:MAG: alginate export family protein [Verrucomicrobiales bacterium]
MLWLGATSLAQDPQTQFTHGFELQVTGEIRSRFETLDGQFRLGRAGGDQVLLFRTLIHPSLTFGPLSIGLEVQDSRAYLDDRGTPLSSSFVNPVDYLQLYAAMEFASPGEDHFRSRLILGRQTISIGSKRQIERVSYANVIRSYTGAYWSSIWDRGDEFHAFAVVPVGRRPFEFSSLEANEIVADDEQWNRLVWGLHYRRADAIPKWLPGLWIEGFVYGLQESDSVRSPTPNRDYVTPGIRLYRAPANGEFDFDVEGALRFGSRRATSLPNDTTDLRVFSSMLYAVAGYTFDHPWKPRIAAQYYWASGDKTPSDGQYDQYERLFGGRRTDLGNTSIFGPLTPANLSAPGLRFELRPSEALSARLTYSAAFLASDTDSWVIARLRDPSGNSGSFLGHVFDSRVVKEFPSYSLELELGASAMLHGEFSDHAPLSPAPGTTWFAYSSLTFDF